MINASSLKYLIGLVSAILFWLGSTHALTLGADNSPRELLIVYSGMTLGELKPCGCAKEEDQGGIERRMSYLRESKKQATNYLLVDVGDNFKDPTPQGKIKAEFLMESMRRMGYDAISLGDKDLVYGNRFVLDLKNIPWISSNIDFNQEDIIPKARIKRYHDGLKVAILAVSDPDLFYDLKKHAGIKIEDPKTTIDKFLPQLRQSEKPDLIVLLAHMRRESALKFLDINGIDIVINGHIETETDVIDMDSVQAGGRIFVQPGPKGQKLGELRVAIDNQGQKSYKQKMVKLDSSVKNDGEMVKLYEEYDEKIEALFFSSLADKKNNRRKNYASDSVCKTCHTETHDVWSNSRHAKAYSTLLRVNKAFDPECLKCHTTGFDKPGGFISEVDTPDLKNVQCEVCHGPGLMHADSPKPGFGAQANQACQQCHVKNHSPRFDFSEYWSRIKH